MSEEQGQCWDRSPEFRFAGVGTRTRQLCELPFGHGGAHQATDDPSLPPVRWMRFDDEDGEQ